MQSHGAHESDMFLVNIYCFRRGLVKNQISLNDGCSFDASLCYHFKF